jgi:trimeric autotransporter adhesin
MHALGPARLSMLLLGSFLSPRRETIRVYPRSFALVTTVSALFLLTSCGGQSAPTYPQNVSVAMSPKIASIAVNATQQFAATVTNYTATPTWFMQGTAAGTITSSGLYTAPSSPPILNYGGSNGPQAVTTVIASVAYPAANTLFGTAASDSNTFVITAPTVTAGFVTNTASVALGGSFKFQPYAVGALDRNYILQVNGITGGSLGTGTIVQDSVNAGLYTAPAAMPMTGPIVTITVISTADPTKTATATVTLH